MEIKMMVVDQKTIGNTIYPRILFTGQWLIKLGFDIESIVTAIYEAGMLTLEAQGTGIDTYKKIVHNVRQRQGQLFQVKNAVRSEGTHLDLAIQGDWLTRIGFSVGDIVCVRILFKRIEIKKIDTLALGFHPLDSFRTMKVRKRTYKKRQLPLIGLAGQWLDELGFHSNLTALANYKPNCLHFSPCQETVPNKRNEKQPTAINIGSAKHRSQIVPAFSLTGVWLDELGFHIGSDLLVGFQRGHIRIFQLGLETLY